MHTPSHSTSRYHAGIIALVALGKVIFGVDFGMMNVALATISKELHVAPVLLPWMPAAVYAGARGAAGGQPRSCQTR